MREGGSVISLKDCAPLDRFCCCFFESESDLGEGRRQRDLDQRRAVLEGRPDLGEGGRQRDLGQGPAALEGRPSDLGEGGRQRDLGQGPALEEGTQDDLGGPLRDRDRHTTARSCAPWCGGGFLVVAGAVLSLLLGAPAHAMRPQRALGVPRQLALVRGGVPGLAHAEQKCRRTPCPVPWLSVLLHTK